MPVELFWKRFSYILAASSQENVHQFWRRLFSRRQKATVKHVSNTAKWHQNPGCCASTETHHMMLYLHLSVYVNKSSFYLMRHGDMVTLSTCIDDLFPAPNRDIWTKSWKAISTSSWCRSKAVFLCEKGKRMCKVTVYGTLLGHPSFEATRASDCLKFLMALPLVSACKRGY